MGREDWLVGRVGGTAQAVEAMVYDALAHGRHALCMNKMERSESKVIFGSAASQRWLLRSIGGQRG